MNEELMKQVYKEYVKKVTWRRIETLRNTYQDEVRWKKIIKKWDGRPVTKELIENVPFIKDARYEFFTERGMPTIRERKGSIYEGYLQFQIYGQGIVDAKETIKEIEHIMEWYNIMYKCWYHIWQTFEYAGEEHDEFLRWMSKPVCKNWYACILHYKTEDIDKLLDEWEEKRISYNEYRESCKKVA